MVPLVYIWVKSPAKQSSWIMRLQLLGVIFSIHRYQNLAWEREDGKNKQEKGVLAHLGKYRIRIERCR